LDSLGGGQLFVAGDALQGVTNGTGIERCDYDGIVALDAFFRPEFERDGGIAADLVDGVVQRKHFSVVDGKTPWSTATCHREPKLKSAQELHKILLLLRSQLRVIYQVEEFHRIFQR